MGPRLVMAHRIGEMPAGLGGAVRVGFSVELGGGHDPGQSLRWGGLQQAGSGALYLFLGPFW